MTHRSRKSQTKAWRWVPLALTWSEADDMVLLDDNFGAIAAAAEEGRVIYDNVWICETL